MNRRDYATVAEAFHAEVKNEPPGRARAKLRWVATALATKMQLPRARRELFLEACGFNNETGEDNE